MPSLLLPWSRSLIHHSCYICPLIIILFFHTARPLSLSIILSLVKYDYPPLNLSLWPIMRYDIMFYIWLYRFWTTSTTQKRKRRSQNRIYYHFPNLSAHLKPLSGSRCRPPMAQWPRYSDGFYTSDIRRRIFSTELWATQTNRASSKRHTVFIRVETGIYI